MYLLGNTNFGKRIENIARNIISAKVFFIFSWQNIQRDIMLLHNHKIMGKSTTDSTPGQEGAPLNMFEGKIGRRQAIGGFLQLLGFKVATNVTEAMGQDVAAVTNPTAIPNNINWVSRSPFQDDLDSLRALTESPLVENGTQIVEWFKSELEIAISLINANEWQIAKEQLDEAGRWYHLIKWLLEGKEAKLKKEFARLPESPAKQVMRDQYVSVQADLLLVCKIPALFRWSPENKPKSALDILEILEGVCVRQQLNASGKIVQINKITPSLQPGSVKLTELLSWLEEGLKSKLASDPAYKLTGAIDTIRQAIWRFIKPKNTGTINQDYGKMLRTEGFEKVNGLTVADNKTIFKVTNGSIIIDKESGEKWGMIILRANPSGPTTWIIETEGVNVTHLGKDIDMDSASLGFITSGSAWDEKEIAIPLKSLVTGNGITTQQFLVRHTGKQDTLRIMLGGPNHVKPTEYGKVGKIKITPFQRK